MFKNNEENIKISDRNTLFASITNQNFPQLTRKNNNNDQYQSSFLKSSNYSKTPYQERQSFRQHNSSLYQQQSEHSSSQDSTFSFHQYKDILNNLFESSEHEQEWKIVPEIVKLIIKAMSLSINAVQKKVMENRQIINQHGLQIKENQLSLENLTKTLKKFNEKNAMSKSQSSISVRNQEQKKRSFMKEKLQKQENQFSTNGLDLIMIEEVKTITDAIISKKVFEIINQIEELEEKMEENLQKQYQKLQGEIQALKTWIPQLQIKQKIQQEKFQQNIKQHLTLIDKQSTHLIKQLQDEKEAMCQLGHYIEDNFCKRQEVNEVLKSNYDTKGSKATQNYESLNLSRSKVEEIVKSEMQSFQIVKKKEFDEFKQKIMKSINNFATVTQVEKIVNKENKVGKGKKIEEIYELHFNEKSFKDEDTLELRKSKKCNLKDQLKFKQKSPISKKDKSIKISKKKSEKELHSSKVSKNAPKSRKISQFSHQQSLYDSPLIIEEKSAKTKQTPHDRSEHKLSRSQIQQEIQSTLMRKLEFRIKQLKQSNTQIISQQIDSEVNKLQKRLIKRLQTAEEEFCAVVEQNWRTMSENNLKIQKSQKQSMQNLLKVVSVLNVIARYSTIINCQPNDCLKWEKQVFNSTGKGVVTLSTDKSLIYFGVAGVYEIHIVVYTLYDPIVSFCIEINGEEVTKRSERLGVKLEGNDGQKGEQSIMNQVKKGNKKQQALIPTIYHPSNGVQFRSALLIPAKSNLTIKMLNELNGQALMQIRKM